MYIVWSQLTFIKVLLPRQMAATGVTSYKRSSLLELLIVDVPSQRRAWQGHWTLAEDPTSFSQPAVCSSALTALGLKVLAGSWSVTVEED